jgi:hypothetical protein
MKAGIVYLKNGYHHFKDFSSVKRRINNKLINQVCITTSVTSFGEQFGLEPRKIYVHESQIISYPDNHE